ncbi:hypothetical protein EMCRGX_G017093 [Ephydatia muelleri]
MLKERRIGRSGIRKGRRVSFPELLPWVSWCYGSQSLLWHSMVTISSQSGVQQGDPLGPMLFALVLHKLVSSIEADDDCINLSFNAWYLDDGILAGESRNGISLFPASVKSSILPNLEILGAPIGDIVHCSHFFAEKHNLFKVLLRAISDVAAVDLHVAISLLHMCGGYCKLVHLARTTPTNLCEDSLKFFDEEVRLCFSSCVEIHVPDPQWQQAQLSPKLGGRFLSLHSCATFISSVASLEMGNPDNTHLQQAIFRFNARVSHRTPFAFHSPFPELVLDPLGHHEVWYADDASGAGSCADLRVWWDALCSAGPNFGYHPSPSKTFLVTKPEHAEKAKQLFAGTNVSICAGKCCLGAAIGSKSLAEEYVRKKVCTWVEEVKSLACIAATHPNSAYSAFTHGLSSRWTFVSRTMSDIQNLLVPLEHAIHEYLLPALTGRRPSCSSLERSYLALPSNLGDWA